MVVEAADDVLGVGPEEWCGGADAGGFLIGDADPAEAERLVGAIDVQKLGKAVGHGLVVTPGLA